MQILNYPLLLASQIGGFFADVRRTLNPRLWMVSMVYFCFLIVSFTVMEERRVMEPLRCLHQDFRGNMDKMQFNAMCGSKQHLVFRKDYSLLRNVPG